MQAKYKALVTMLPEFVFRSGAYQDIAYFMASEMKNSNDYNENEAQIWAGCGY